MPTLRIIIPEGVDFSALRLKRSHSGISFDWRPIEHICKASGIDADLLKNSSEDNVVGLIVQWYAAHLSQGGARDAEADDLIAEVAAEDNAGSSSFKPPDRLM